MLKYSHILQRPVSSSANRVHTLFFLHTAKGAQPSGRAAGPLGEAIWPLRLLAPDRLSLLPLPSHGAPARSSEGSVGFPPLPSQKFFQLNLSQEFCMRISFLPSANFPGLPASPSLHGGESILRRRLPCLLSRCDFVLQDTKSINESGLYCNVH